LFGVNRWGAQVRGTQLSKEGGKTNRKWTERESRNRKKGGRKGRGAGKGRVIQNEGGGEKARREAAVVHSTDEKGTWGGVRKAAMDWRTWGRKTYRKKLVGSVHSRRRKRRKTSPQNPKGGSRKEKEKERFRTVFQEKRNDEERGVIKLGPSPPKRGKEE